MRDHRRMWKSVAERFAVLRRRLRLTQSELAAAAGVSRRMVQRIEAGSWQNLSVAALERVATALGGRLQVILTWNGEQLDRLVDAGHAELQNAFAQLLRAAGWEVAIEVSFNHYGDRGRYDLIAYHAASGILLVVEIKTVIGDLQATLGTLDVKLRLAIEVARTQGWARPVAVIPVLVVADERQQHRLVLAHAALFARFALRGRPARAWLERPTSNATGLLLYLSMTNARVVGLRKASRGQRVRKPSAKAPIAPPDAHMSSARGGSTT
jgi:transcriptional regulator with XRE-family HTH domain